MFLESTNFRERERETTGCSPKILSISWVKYELICVAFFIFVHVHLGMQRSIANMNSQINAKSFYKCNVEEITENLRSFVCYRAETPYMKDAAPAPTSKSNKLVYHLYCLTLHL